MLTHSHTHSHTFIVTNRFITLTHSLIDTRCLLHTIPVVLSPLTHTKPHTQLTPKLVTASPHVCVYFCSQTDIETEMWILTWHFDAEHLSLSGTWEKRK